METTRTINKAFGPGTASECTVHWFFKNFCKGDKSLKVRRVVAGHRKLTTNNWVSSLKVILYSCRRRCQRIQHQLSYNNLAFETNWKGEKILWICASWADCKKKKKHFEVSSSFTLWDNEPFLNLIVSCDDVSIVICDKKQILYNNRQQAAQWLDQEAPKHLLNLNFHQKKIMVTVWWSAVHLFHYSFLNPSKTITSKKYAQQIEWHASKNAMPTAGIGEQNGPNSFPQQCQTTLHTTNISKVEWIGLQSFASFAIFTWPLSSQPPLLQASPQLYVGTTLKHPAGCRKGFPRVQILKHDF